MYRQSPLINSDTDEKLASLEGIVDRVTFHSEESGYSVLRLLTREQPEPVTVVGGFPNPNAGESLLLFGRWTQHPKFGPQFQAERFQVKQPATVFAIQKYLGSGLIKGVGPVMAKRLVAQFGEDTLRVIEEEPERLVEAEGIGKKRVELITRAWSEQKEIQNIMLFLQGHGVSATYAVKIYKAYGDRAIEQVTENPYRLAEDIWGIGFKTADKIAQALGLAADAPARLEAGEMYALTQAQDAGHCYLPRETMIRTAAELLGVDPDVLEAPLSRLVEEGKVVAEALEDGSEALFHPALYHTEVGIAGLLGRLLREGVRDDLTPDRAAAGVAKIAEREGIALSEEQQEAVVKGLLERVLVITGGPGVGKTTTTRTLVQALRFRKRRVVLASPTGRAAKRLSEVVGAEAKTLHRLLEFDPSNMGFKHNADAPLDLDTLIVDEASMLDANLFYQLLKALPGHAQLILVGDVDQLPSVGAGNVLRDLIESGVLPVARLTQVFRQAASSLIITNAHRINAGEMPVLVPPAQRGEADCLFIEAEEPEEVASMIAGVVSRSLTRLGFPPKSAQVLCPMNRGTVGAGNLNRVLQETLNPARNGAPEVTRMGRTFRSGDRVIQLRNNYDKEVFNGEIGEVAGIDMEDQKIAVAFPEARVSYEFSELDELQLAYGLSIHKAQGSEYPAVVLPVHTQHYTMLAKNLLYTALTRAKRMVVMVGTRKAIGMAVRNAEVSRRNTRLQARLREAYEGKREK
ncbi:MAG: ATP-dependent RecD-like DNA helicase [Armatimonadetes bacterium]|nr:ATP-dependent RecD-like DNA helicase [Armatimonadota bacterium]